MSSDTSDGFYKLETQLYNWTPGMLGIYLKDINDEGMTVFVITHEEEVAEQTKRIVRLKDGVIISDELTKASKAV